MKRRLFPYECRKLWAPRFLRLACALLLIANAVICFFSIPSDPDAALLDAVWAEYRADPAAMEACAARLSAEEQAAWQHQAEAVINGEIPAGEPVPPAEVFTFDKNGRLSDLTLINRVRREALGGSRAVDWRGQIQRIVRAAGANKRELSDTQQVPEDSFAYRQQDNAERVYASLLESVTFRDGFVRGWRAFFNYEPVGLFIAVTLLLGTVSVFLAERDGGAMLLRTYKRGRGRTAAAKLGAALAFSVCVTLAFLLSAGAAVALREGLSDPRQAIQAVPGFELVPYAWTVGGYLLRFTLAHLLSSAVLTLTAALVMILSDSPAAAFGIPALAVAGGYILYHSRADETLRLLDPYAYSLYVPLTSRYHCFPVGDALGEPLPAVRVTLGVLAAALVLGCIVLFAHRRPTARRARPALSETLRARTDKLSARLPRRRRPTRGHTSLVYWEWRKQVVNPRFLILFVVTLALQGLLIVRRTEPGYGYQQSIYRGYLAVVGGKQTPEKSAWIAAEDAFIKGTLDKERVNESLFLSGEMDADDYFAYLDDLIYADTHAAAFARVTRHERYLTDTAARTGIGGVFLFEDDWVTYLTAGADWLMLLLILFTVSGICGDEYNAAPGMDPARSLIRSSKRGRRDVFRAKLILALSLSAALSLLAEGAETAAALSRLDLNTPGAPLLSLELFENTDGGITLLGFAVLRLALRFVGMMTAAALGLSLGELLKNRVWAFAASAGLFALPYACGRFGIPFMTWLDPSLPLDGTRLWLLTSARGNDPYPLLAYLAALTAAAALLLILAARHYTRTGKGGLS